MASRKRRTQNHGDLEHRVNRAMTRIQLGELFAGRMALEGADLAPGTQATLTQMRQRTARPQDLLPPEIVHFEPASLFSLDEEKFVVNFCFSWRGTAGGHSGVTSIPPNTENWLRKRYDENYNNDTSNVTKPETNHSMNNDTRNMHIT